MFKSIISSKRYWISVVSLGIGLVVLISIIEYIKRYGDLGFDTFLNDMTNNGLWGRYILSRIVGGLIYGMIFGYYIELRKRKSKQK